MSSDNQDEKPSKRKRGTTTYQASYRPFEVRPRLAERTRPMVQLLQKAAKFSWDEKCEEIFQWLKKFLSSETVIQKSRPDQPIVVYLLV